MAVWANLAEVRPLTPARARKPQAELLPAWQTLAVTIIIQNRMRKPRSRTIPPPDDLFPTKKRKPIPHEFVLEALAALSPRTNPMFGCLAVYVRDVDREEKIVLILRDRPTAPADNGVWLATTVEHHASLRADFPSLRSIGVLGKDVTGWQILPADSPDFEEAALRACEMVIARDPRIGKVPKTKKRQVAKRRQSQPKQQKKATKNTNKTKTLKTARKKKR
jgi:hypothetical protein